ncbi:MAG: NUDIX domain-containing protein [Candidatus Aenigmarchaeota archaeon]|nr:NUDIX domain-containing protein [Candidatus Aenigmarchaeota archaeon]
MDERKAHYIAVTAIVVKDGKYLIAKRSMDEKVFPGLWTVPGGKIEVSDYKSLPKDTGSHWYNIFENALRREVREDACVGAGLKTDTIFSKLPQHFLLYNLSRSQVVHQRGTI